MGDIGNLNPNGRTLKYQPTPFGKAMLKHFAFAPGYRNLNHGAYQMIPISTISILLNLFPGSYGTWPTAIRDKATELRNQCEETPCPFIKFTYAELLDENRLAISKFLQVPVTNVVFLPNATTGINTVLRNIVWNPDAKDEILQFNIIYGACGKSTEYIRESTRNLVTVREIQLTYPLEDDELLVLFKAGIAASRSSGHRPRLAIFDTIVSNPGVRLPFEALTAICREEDILSLIDGAHGIGHIDLNLSTMNPDFFVSNFHKWLFVPRGCAVFYVPERNQALMRSTLPTSHGFVPEEGITTQRHMSGRKQGGKSAFELNFEFVGTADNTPNLCVIEAIRWREEVCGGEEKIRTYCQDLARRGGKLVAEILGTRILDNKAGTLTDCNLVNILLPVSIGIEKGEGESDGAENGVKKRVFDWMLNTLIVDYKTFMPVFWFQDAWWVRLSSQVYLDMEDFEWAGRALRDLCDRVQRGEYLEGPERD
jgi:selenocysteine lyase/cysteine desulfurase